MCVVPSSDIFSSKYQSISYVNHNATTLSLTLNKHIRYRFKKYSHQKQCYSVTAIVYALRWKICLPLAPSKTFTQECITGSRESLVFYQYKYNEQNIAPPFEDRNHIFSCSQLYLSRNNTRKSNSYPCTAISIHVCIFVYLYKCLIYCSSLKGLEGMWNG